MNLEGKRLSELLANTGAKGLKGSADPMVTSIVIDSRRAAPGCLFFALPGQRRDGNSFVDEAINRGAVAVVASKPWRLGNPKAVFVTLEDPRRALAKASRAFFDFPDKALELVGVTGTNGKTTVARLIKAFLSVGGAKTGCLGTIGYDLVDRVLPAFRTTPESQELCGLLSQMRGYGCERAVMEVSSHGIDQCRVEGLEFDAAVFLNLTRDHLDYHGDMESYYQVKRRLFNGEIGAAPKSSIVNLDDPYGVRLVEELGDRSGLITFGLNEQAMVSARDIELDQQGARFTLVLPGKTLAVSSPLIGQYNVSNLLAALATCVALGADIERCVGSLPTFKGIPGRMEKVEAGQPFSIVVDYAHTDDALRNALSMLREITPGKLLSVFGCGGDRDRGKRGPMTRAAVELSDRCWATADNPRGESLDGIFADMREGVGDATNIEFISDRRRAIELAIKAAAPGDCLVIAGKGHESFQEFADTVMSFDDRKVTRELVELMLLGKGG